MSGHHGFLLKSLQFVRNDPLQICKDSFLELLFNHIFFFRYFGKSEPQKAVSRWIKRVLL